MVTGVLSGKGKIWWIVALVVLCLVPLCCLGSMFTCYQLSFFFGLLATSNDFPLGFGGLYQLHHAVFYGVGAYATAIVITKSGLSPWLAFIIGPIISAALGLVMGFICADSQSFISDASNLLDLFVWAVVFGGIPLPVVMTASMASLCRISSPLTKEHIILP